MPPARADSKTQSASAAVRRIDLRRPRRSSSNAKKGMISGVVCRLGRRSGTERSRANPSTASRLLLPRSTFDAWRRSQHAGIRPEDHWTTLCRLDSPTHREWGGRPVYALGPSHRDRNCGVPPASLLSCLETDTACCFKREDNQWRAGEFSLLRLWRRLLRA
jgi:hypothetical protein